MNGLNECIVHCASSGDVVMLRHFCDAYVFAPSPQPYEDMKVAKGQPARKFYTEVGRTPSAASNISKGGLTDLNFVSEGTEFGGLNLWTGLGLR